MIVEIEVTDELKSKINNCRILWACDWTEEMADDAQDVVEQLYYAAAKVIPTDEGNLV